MANPTDWYQNFELWIKFVDRNLISVTGMGVEDLPDANYREMFEAEWTPLETSLSVLSQNGY